ncbi:hypothetical protein SNE40_019575 [Patella caerulea]|uniref:J domain-containing protein n=1 Tax=Patella caerulea TaxID=87958 RepID=A0AAN8J7N6_PATCE
MEGNKDESERCMKIALKCIEVGDEDKALKFLNKANRLYPSEKAKKLIASLTEMNGHANAESKTEHEGVRQRKHSHSKDKSESNKENATKDYTDEQLISVKRISKCKDYYEILAVSKEADESDLKKAYRKLALQMHPDKNKAPGATEAFKAIGNAFSVLNDPDKRRKYDLYGPEQEISSSRGRSQEYDYSHGFEGDISPEELFNMFFGGGFPSSATARSRHRHTHNHRTYYYQQNQNQTESGYTLFLQLAPILLLVLLSLLSSFFVSDPVFSMHRTSKYSVERKTYNLRVPYFVKDDFRPEYKGDLRRIERQVEEEYISQLRSNCWRERSYKENMLWTARSSGDPKLYQRAQELKTPNCDQLQSMYS